MLRVLLCLYLFLRDMRLVLLLVCKGATRILVMVVCKTAKERGRREQQANDGRAYFTTCTHPREILILQAYRTRQMHDEIGHFWFEGAGERRNAVLRFKILWVCFWDFERGVLQMTSLSGMLIEFLLCFAI
jgi:hypothetical protein